jgi:hypothetical protein
MHLPSIFLAHTVWLLLRSNMARPQDAVSPRIPEPAATVTASGVRVGIDVGGVLCCRHRVRAGNSASQAWWLDAASEVPHAMAGLQRLVAACGPDNVFVISKAHDRMRHLLEIWLFSTMDICGQTGILKDNIHFCEHRSGPNGKGVMADTLRISHYIDDKLECLHSIYGDTAGNAAKHIDARGGKLILFSRSGTGDTRPIVPDRMADVFVAAAHWKDVLNILLPGAGTKGGDSASPPAMQAITRTKMVTWDQEESVAEEDDGEQESEEEGATHWAIEEEYYDMHIAQAHGHWGVALSDFNGSTYGPEYLDLQEGEQIFVYPASPLDEGWLHAWSNRLGEYGWIPPSYVSLRN